MTDRQHDPDVDDFDTYRRLILAELKRLNKECEIHSDRMTMHELADKDFEKQIALEIQALQLRAEAKGREAGEAAGKKEGATWGAAVSAILIAIAQVTIWVVQHWPT